MQLFTFNKEVNMDKELVRHVFILIISFYFLSKSCKGKNLPNISRNGLLLHFSSDNVKKTARSAVCRFIFQKGRFVCYENKV
jgi:hypothetical protein